MSITNQKGNVITYVVIAMSTIAALGVGLLYMSSSAALGGLGANNLNKAYFLALAGKEYALVKNLQNTGGRTFTLQDQSGQILPGNDKFRLIISGDTIESTGIVKEGTPSEARRKISITKTGFARRPDISFAKDIQSFTSPVQSQAGFIATDTAAAKVTLGQIGMTSTFGALWYGGSAMPGDCTNGKCSFGAGFRAFFVFQFGAGSSGDGFTFAFFNGDDADSNGVKNDINSVGGDTSMGELMGYAGDSRIDSTGTSFLDGKGGRGIQPPKMAIEFDVYPSYGSANVCSSGSRRDGNDNRNHVAYVFWGENTNSSCTTTIGRNTYDDNRHNAGTDGPTDPRNSRRPTDGADTSYFDASSVWPTQTSWLLSNTPTNIYAVRLEVIRSTTPNAGGNYDYTVHTWVKQCLVDDIACPTYDDTTNYSNTKINYITAVPGDTPTLTRTFALSPTYHQNFDTFYFGWTAATGGATQTITINRFGMYFVK